MDDDGELAAGRIRVKRIYRAARNSDGKRVLVDRLWPRGMPKSRARVDLWMKELAPSDALRRWYHDHPEEFETFRARYRDELLAQEEAVAELLALAETNTVTLLYASRNETGNNAVVLRDHLLATLQRRGTLQGGHTGGFSG